MQAHENEETLDTDEETTRSRPSTLLPVEVLETASTGRDKATSTAARQVAPEEMAGSAARCLFCRYRGPGMGKVELS